MMTSRDILEFLIWGMMSVISVATAYGVHQLLLRTGYVTFWRLRDIIELFGLVTLLMMWVQMFLIILIDKYIHRKK